MYYRQTSVSDIVKIIIQGYYFGKERNVVTKKLKISTRQKLIHAENN